MAEVPTTKGDAMSVAEITYPMPLSYVYRGQVQEAAMALHDALELWKDSSILSNPNAGRLIVKKLNEARQRLENVVGLQAEGITH